MWFASTAIAPKVQANSRNSRNFVLQAARLHGRKNYLFFGSLTGGRTATTLYSVVQSAKLYHLDVTAYLTDVLRRLSAIEPKDRSAFRELFARSLGSGASANRAVASPRSNDVANVASNAGVTSIL